MKGRWNICDDTESWNVTRNKKKVACNASISNVNFKHASQVRLLLMKGNRKKESSVATNKGIKSVNQP